MAEILKFPSHTGKDGRDSGSSGLEKFQMDLGQGYACHSISMAVGESSLLPKDEDLAAWSKSSDHLLLNVQRPDGSIGASLVVDIKKMLVEHIYYDWDRLKPVDAAAVSRLMTFKEWGRSYNFPKDNFVYTADGKCHSFRTLPDKIMLRGDIAITNMSNVRLPDTIVTTGFLFITGTSVDKAPSYLNCDGVEIIQSTMSSVAAVLQTKKLEITECRIQKLCNIAHISGDVTICGPLSPIEPPDAIRIGGDLTFTADTFTQIPANIVVMRDVSGPREFEPFPYGADFLGRILQPGDHVRFLTTPRIFRDGKTALHPMVGYCAKFTGCDKAGKLLLSIEDGDFQGEDEISVTSSDVIKCSGGDYAQRRISYKRIMGS